jgi:hypothetical protein
MDARIWSTPLSLPAPGMVGASMHCLLGRYSLRWLAGDRASPWAGGDPPLPIGAKNADPSPAPRWRQEVAPVVAY